jgi:hypothetical protein
MAGVLVVKPDGVALRRGSLLLRPHSPTLAERQLIGKWQGVSSGFAAKTHHVKLDAPART